MTLVLGRGFLVALLALTGSVLGAGCSSPGAADVDAASARTDTGVGARDTGAADGSATSDDGGSQRDATSSEVDAAAVDASSPASDAASAAGCLFAGRYVATNIRCNGAPFTGAAALMPPAGGWYVDDDGTTATFTQTIGTCSLVATGTIACDSPAVGQFTHHPSGPLTCSPTGCTPFSAACTGAAGTDATWTYTRNADGSIEAATVGDATPIRTCTAAHQQNPVQITWVPIP